MLIGVLRTLFEEGFDFQISTAHDVIDWSLGNPADGIIARGAGDSIDDAVHQLADAAAKAWPETSIGNKHKPENLILENSQKTNRQNSLPNVIPIIQKAS